MMLQKHQLQEKNPNLALSEKNNNGAPRTRSRSREVTSRYKISSSSSSSASAEPAAVPPGRALKTASASSLGTSGRRCASPNVPRSQAELPNPKRAQSAERRRPSPSPRPSTPRTEGLWPSTRNLSFSMQKEKEASASPRLLKSAANVAESAAQRKPTPERKRASKTTESENARPMDNSHPKPDPKPKPDQQRWPARKLSGAALTRSVDLTLSDRPSKITSLLTTSSGSKPPNRAFLRSVNEPPISSSVTTRRASLDGRARTPTRKVTSSSPSRPSSESSLEETRPNSSKPVSKQRKQNAHEQTTAGTTANTPEMASDTESVSSSGNSLTLEPNKRIVRRSSSVGRGSSVSARFLNESSNGTKPGFRSTVSDGADLASSNLTRQSIRLKRVPSSGSVTNGPERVLASPRFANRFTGLQHSLSPIKMSVSSSPSRAQLSPTKARTQSTLQTGSLMLSKSQNNPSLLSFGVDVRKGKKGLSQVEDIHDLRMLNNRLLQWRFVNARSEATMHAQKATAEKMLYNVWLATAELQDSVRIKQVKLQQARQEDKLSSILRQQMPYLEEWRHLDREHANSLEGATRALESAIVRLPVTGGARADLQSVWEAVHSAHEWMQVTESTLFSLLPKIEGMNNLVSDLAEVAAKEKAMLGECTDLLAMTALMEVEESSVRAHLIQLKQGGYPDLGEPVDTHVVPIRCGQ